MLAFTEQLKKSNKGGGVAEAVAVGEEEEKENYGFIFD